MLSPSELKKRQFSRAFRGYSANEVDEHLDFLLEKYTELYIRNDDLEKELRKVRSELDAIRTSEEAIRKAMVNAQREERRVIDEANDRANLILRTAKLNTDRIITEFKAEIREERIVLHKLRKAVAEFKANSLKQYNLHLEFLNSISPDPDAPDPELELTEDDYANSLLEQMKLALESADFSDVNEKEETEEELNIRRMPEPQTEKKHEEQKEQPFKTNTAVFTSVPHKTAASKKATTREFPVVKK